MNKVDNLTMKIILKILMITTSVYAVSDKQEDSKRDHLPEYGNFFEGDMVLNDEQNATILSPVQINQRNGLIEEKYRWPNNTLFYEIHEDFNADQVRAIEKALLVIQNNSCIRFEKRNNHTKAYVHVTARRRGCYSEIGCQGKKQVLNLQPAKLGKGCFSPGTIMHEFLHALGFYHQQNAPDRDDYVKIANRNIFKGTEGNFQKHMELTEFGIPYDYDSVMHYAADAFSKNGRATIVPLRKSSFKIGQRTHLSDADISKLNIMYHCH